MLMMNPNKYFIHFIKKYQKLVHKELNILNYKKKLKKRKNLDHLLFNKFLIIVEDQ